MTVSLPTPEKPQVVLSGFADEAANQKTAVEQFAAFAAIGLQYYSLRFVDVGGGLKNVMDLTKPEIIKLRHLEDEYGMNVASIGSPIGKVKLRDVEDGTTNRYVPFDQYLKKDVARACELAHAFETKLIRGFSFYHPKGSEPAEFVPQAADQLGADRRSLPPQRSDVRPRDRSEPGRPVGPADGRAAPSREPSRAGHDLRRRQHRQPGLHDRRVLPAIPGDEAWPRLDAHQRLPPTGTHHGTAGRAARPTSTRTSSRISSRPTPATAATSGSCATSPRSCRSSPRSSPSAASRA